MPLRSKRLLPPVSTLLHLRDLRSLDYLTAAKPTLFEKEFSLADRVALVSGANRGLGLEMAMALIEAGARAVYCTDIPKTPGDEWQKVKKYLDRMDGAGRLEYISADVREQVRSPSVDWSS